MNMAVQNNILLSYEQELIRIVQHLPVERIAQIVDFARYIQSQTSEDFLSFNDECEEDVLADEAQWEAQFEATQDGLTRMAARIREEIRAGRTQSIKLKKSGGMIPG
jgi:hypothetical protein